MRKFGVCLALTGAAVWLTGCGMQFGGSSSSSSSRGGIAVVDLDKVAAETGKSIEMKEGFELQQNSWKQALVKAEVDLNAQLQTKVKELGEDATDEAKREVAQFRLNASNNLAKAQNLAGQTLTKYQQDQIAKFRTELKPVLQEVAMKRGLSVVVPKNDGLLLAVDPGVDITDDVIKGYRALKPAPTAAAPAAAPAQAAAKPAAPARTAAKETDAAAK